MSKFLALVLRHDPRSIGIELDPSGWSQRMHRAGHGFFLSANGVWLTDHVPSAFVRALDLDGRG